MYSLPNTGGFLDPISLIYLVIGLILAVAGLLVGKK